MADTAQILAGILLLLDSAYRIAAGRVIVMPTPTAEPWRATMVGFAQRCIASVTFPPLESVLSPYRNPGFSFIRTCL